MNSKPLELRRFRYLVFLAALLTFLLIVMGGIVRVTESGLGCPDWPTCYGKLIPPLRMDAILEYLHRLIASLASPFILLAAGIAFRRYRHIRWLTRPLLAAVALLGFEVALGAVTVLRETPPEIVAAHFATALTILALVLMAAVVAFFRYHDPSAERLTFPSPFGRLTLATLLAVFVALISGALVTGSGSTYACGGWPLCNGELFPATSAGWVHMTHRFIVGLAGVLMVAMFLRAWRTQYTQTAILSAATLATVLFFAQAFVGALKTMRGFPVFLLGLHVTTAAAAWTALVILATLVGLAGRRASEEEVEASRQVNIRQRLGDFLMMTRPIVVLLLLTTACAGLAIAGRSLPPFKLAFWTLFGGALAAGGAQAVNQYVDRDIDRLMGRTARRPLPAGRLTPAEGLAWGLGLCAVSVYIIAGFVNWLAALLTLAGILYYVILYTLVMKRTSPQNIVIGGGAGALCPVIGWAAATGRLDWMALALFAIIFLWTPPHFWALSLVRLKDYARAGIPMLPVVKGEDHTRRQIFLYTVSLVAVTLILPLIHLAGMVYLVGAVLLGGMLIFAAWRVWRIGGNKFAWSLYRISNMYLAFLMLALVLDALTR